MCVYLDYNVIMQVWFDVIEFMSEFMGSVGNVLVVYQYGQVVCCYVDEVCCQVGKVLCVCVEDVIFMGGGMEVFNLVMVSVICVFGVKCVIIFDIEYFVIVESVKVFGLLVDILLVMVYGVIDLFWLEQCMVSWFEVDGCFVLVVMLVNNEIGMIQLVVEVIVFIKEKDGFVIVDVVQFVGKILVDFVVFGVDYMVIVVYKFGGFQGVGVLIVLCDVFVIWYNYGGGQEQGCCLGMLNVVGNVVFGLVLEQVYVKFVEFVVLVGLCDCMIVVICEVNLDVVVLGEGVDCLFNMIGLVVLGWCGEIQVMVMDFVGVLILAGVVCLLGKVKVLKMGIVLGLDEVLFEGVIWISLGWLIIEEDVDVVIKVWIEVWVCVLKQIKEMV